MASRIRSKKPKTKQTVGVVKTSVVLNLKGKKVSLTIEEVRLLKYELERIFGHVTTYPSWNLSNTFPGAMANFGSAVADALTIPVTATTPASHVGFMASDAPPSPKEVESALSELNAALDNSLNTVKEVTIG
jgi:hypothetical protein